MKDTAGNPIDAIEGYVITRNDGQSLYYLSPFFTWCEYDHINETHIHDSLDNALSFISDPEWPGPPPQEIIEAKRVGNYTVEVCRFGYTTDTSQCSEVGLVFPPP